MRGFNYLRLDGSTKAEERGELIDRFNSPDSPYFIFVLSTRAGALGLNLQTADTVIFFDSDWNPQTDLQAQERTHRIGHKEVLVFRLISSNSIEEKILQRALCKLSVDDKQVINNKSDDQERKEMLENLIRERYTETVSSVIEFINLSQYERDKQINQMLARNLQELKLFKSIDRERELREKADWAIKGNTGLLPKRLMQLDELPPCILKEDFDFDQEGYSHNF